MSGNSKSDIELYLSTGVDFRRKSMDLVGDIDDGSVEQWTRAIRYLDRAYPERPLTIYMNSSGGSVYQGLALIDTIKACESEVHIHVVGECMSMAVWVLQAADRRTASPNSRLMLHIGSFELEEDHHHTNLRWADQYRRDERILKSMLCEVMDITPSAVGKLLAYDTILLPHEAREKGLIDEVTG